MTNIARILVDEAHRQAWTIDPALAARMNPANPSDAGYVVAAQALRHAGCAVEANSESLLTSELLADFDVLVLNHAATDDWESTTLVGNPALTADEIAAVVEFVRAGGGLVLLAETEQLKYGNSHQELARQFGIEIKNCTVQDPVRNHKEVATWVLGAPQRTPGLALLAGVEGACFYRSGALEIRSDHEAAPAFVMTTSETAQPANSGLVAIATLGQGRVVVVADSDIFGDDSIQELSHETLWRNLVTWAATPAIPRNNANLDVSITETTSWKALVGAVEQIRTFQEKDGSINLEIHAEADVRSAVANMRAAVAELAPHFPHQEKHLAATLMDIDKWVANGFAVPDFFDSLMLFRPDLDRRDGVRNLVVFPMYTQNGNLNRNFEAVITSTYWPDWLAEQERTKYTNPAFVPIEFVGFTEGYNTHSAVLFPETVATREVGTFHWGGIFCDRESARFRRIASEASALLKLDLPADAAMLLKKQDLARDTFVLWDLIHDRAHSHGDLPFDPFMIKQRMPFWLYALEELRCDLNTYRETLALETQGVHLARFIRFAILFDRLFRFPITGTRVRNYDGLGGQLIFAWLHRHDVLRWTDNTLSLDWVRLDQSVVELCEAIDELYRDGIDRSRIAHWLATHQFVSQWVEPHPASVWAKGAEALPLTGENKEIVDAVLADEFPLNVFYDALRTKLAPTIASVAGITGATA